MPVIGAIVHLSPEPHLAQEALQFLQQHPAVTLATPQQGGLPIAVESDSKLQDQQFWDLLKTVTGINDISVVYADFSDLVEGEPS